MNWAEFEHEVNKRYYDPSNWTPVDGVDFTGTVGDFVIHPRPEPILSRTEILRATLEDIDPGLAAKAAQVRQEALHVYKDNLASVERLYETYVRERIVE